MKDHGFPPQIDAEYESEDYYLKKCGGFDAYLQRRVYPKYRYAVKLAGGATAPIKRVLDIGCGRGELVDWFCARRTEAVGIEYSRTACRLAASLLDANPNRHLATIINLQDGMPQFPDGHFDAAFMLDVIEHLSDEQLDYYYASLKRWLRPGGVLVLHTWPNRRQRECMAARYEMLARKLCSLPYHLLFRAQMKTELRDECERLVHINEHTPDQLRRHLARHGYATKVFTLYFPCDVPESLAVFCAEVVINAGPLGLIPGLRESMNRYIWGLAVRCP